MEIQGSHVSKPTAMGAKPAEDTSSQEIALLFTEIGRITDVLHQFASQLQEHLSNAKSTGSQEQSLQPSDTQPLIASLKQFVAAAKGSDPVQSLAEANKILEAMRTALLSIPGLHSQQQGVDFVVQQLVFLSLDAGDLAVANYKLGHLPPPGQQTPEQQNAYAQAEATKQFSEADLKTRSQLLLKYLENPQADTPELHKSAKPVDAHAHAQFFGGIAQMMDGVHQLAQLSIDSQKHPLNAAELDKVDSLLKNLATAAKNANPAQIGDALQDIRTALLSIPGLHSPQHGVDFVVQQLVFLSLDAGDLAVANYKLDHLPPPGQQTPEQQNAYTQAQAVKQFSETDLTNRSHLLMAHLRNPQAS